MIFPRGFNASWGTSSGWGAPSTPGILRSPDVTQEVLSPGPQKEVTQPRPPAARRSQRGPPPAVPAPPPRGGGGRRRRGRPRGSPRRRKPGPVPSRSAPGCHFKVNKAAEVRAGDGLRGGTGLRNRYRNRAGGARVPVTAGEVLRGSFRGAPFVPRGIPAGTGALCGWGAGGSAPWRGSASRGSRVGGHTETPPLPLSGTGVPTVPRSGRGCALLPCSVLREAEEPRHSCGGFGDGGEGDGATALLAAVRCGPTWGRGPPLFGGTASLPRAEHRHRDPPPSATPPLLLLRPPSAQVTPRGSSFPRCTCRGGQSVGLCRVCGVVQRGGGGTLGRGAAASPPVAPHYVPPPAAPLRVVVPLSANSCSCALEANSQQSKTKGSFGAHGTGRGRIILGRGSGWGQHSSTQR